MNRTAKLLSGLALVFSVAAHASAGALDDLRSIGEAGSALSAPEASAPETRSSYDRGPAAAHYMYLMEEAVPLLEELEYAQGSLQLAQIRIEEEVLDSLSPDSDGSAEISQAYCDLVHASSIYLRVDEALSKKVLPALKTLGAAPAASHALAELLRVLPRALRSANSAAEATPELVASARTTVDIFSPKDKKEMLVELKDIEEHNSRILKNLAVARRLVYNLSASPLSK